MITLNSHCILTIADYDETTQAEPTGRLLPDNDDRTEYYGYGTLAGLRARATYMISAEDEATMAEQDGDGSAIDWKIDHVDIMTDDGVIVATVTDGD